MNVPVTRRDDTVENYHGTVVTDPYRWLEDESSTETKAWVEAQNDVARAYLDALPERAGIKKRYTELYNYARYSVPSRKGEWYFFYKNDGLQNQAVLYRQKGLEGEATVVLDPNTLSSDGTLALSSEVASEDGNLLAYGVSASGSDWQEIRIRNIEERRDYDEVIRWCKFASIAWRHDNTGFYYNRLPDPATVAEEDQSNFSQVYWHSVGTGQEADELVFERPEAKELSFSPFISDDGRYLFLSVWEGTNPNNRLYYREVASDGAFVRLLDDADANYEYIGNDGPIFYVQTNLNAPHGRIVAIDSEHAERTGWREIVAEQEDILVFAAIVHEQMVLVTMHNVSNRVLVYEKDGRFVHEIELPTLGSIGGISGRPQDNELFFSFTSYLYPTTIFHYRFEDQGLSVVYEVQHAFDSSEYQTEQVFFPSKDGTQVSMFLTHRKNLVLDGDNPVLLYGYGGFDIGLTPSFAVSHLLWIERGGIYAEVNLRGGNEYGEEWHKAGMLEKKQNVFDDFIAAAEWLIEKKYTRPERIATMGGSNGGLLVAACLVQRPDLYGAVVCQVPVIDMLRYHRFTVGRYWVSEFGNAEASAEQFAFMYKYSPLHNVKVGVEYPPTLIMTADSDDRVVPAHARKFAATLQAAQAGDHPILLRVEMKAGHGAGKPTGKVIEEQSDIYAFLLHVLHVA
jgi:prolyl oligopeptidase